MAIFDCEWGPNSAPKRRAENALLMLDGVHVVSMVFVVLAFGNVPSEFLLMAAYLRMYLRFQLRVN